MDREEVISRSPPYKMGKLTYKDITVKDYVPLHKQLHDDPIGLILDRHDRGITHYPRTYLMLPVLYLASVLGVSHHLIFSILVVFLLTLTSIFMQKNYELNGGKLLSSSMFSLILGLTAFTSMNGRMVWGLLAVSSIIYILSQLHFLKPKNIILSVLATQFISSISTGVFFFIFLLFLVYSFVARKLNSISTDKFISVLVALLFFVYFFIDAFAKNHSFFGGDFFSFFRALESHGVLSMMIREAWYYVIPTLIVVLYACYRLARTNKISLPLKMTLYTFLFSGTLGIGVFFLALVPFILVMFILVEKAYFIRSTH